MGRGCQSCRMNSTRLLDMSFADQAEQTAERAARASEVSIHILDSPEDLRSVNELFAGIWGPNGQEPIMTTTLLTAFAHNGNYVAGAFRFGELVAASVGFLGKLSSHVHLHSQITGVVPSFQGRSVGFAMKQHQRAWALSNGVEEITWTFDPLVGRNAHFNINKLGAGIVGYKENFYGPMSDSINRDDESDRCLVAWDLSSDRVVNAAEGSPTPPDVVPAALPLLDKDASGSPVLKRQEAPVLLALIPRDIIELREERPSEAAAWRVNLREALVWAFGKGYVVTGMTREGQYVLTRSG